MSDLIWLTEAQMRRIEPYFPLSHGVSRVDDRRTVSGIISAVTDQHSSHLDYCCGEMDEAGEVDGSPVVTRCVAPEVFQLVDASFDAVAVPVSDSGVRDGELTAAVRWITAVAPMSAMSARKALLS